jgi:hypothetical protein
MDSSTDCRLLRHTLATLAYRANNAFTGAPEGFASFRAFESTRTPGEILAHLGDLFDWAVSLVRGQQVWHNSAPLDWDAGTRRFFGSLEALDRELGNGGLGACTAEQLFQGPIADALTHVGQIAMLRRIAGAPVQGENYFVAQIEIGRTGSDQAKAVYQF